MGTFRSLVAYFSATGTTEAVARRVAAIAGADIIEIAPEVPYTPGDLDWNDKQSRSSLEMKNPGARPPLKTPATATDGYDTVFIGYPIWWGVAPREINTFIESTCLKGKRIIPFATSGGSGMSYSVNALRNTYPDLKLEDGMMLTGSDDGDIRKWVDGL